MRRSSDSTEPSSLRLSVSWRAFDIADRGALASADAAGGAPAAAAAASLLFRDVDELSFPAEDASRSGFLSRFLARDLRLCSSTEAVLDFAAACCSFVAGCGGKAFGPNAKSGRWARRESEMW